MNEHQAIVDYLVAKGEDSWRVGIHATEVLSKIRAIEEKRQLSLSTEHGEGSGSFNK